MRTNPTRFEQRVVSCLQQHGVLSFTDLLRATDAPNDPLLARTLNRMRRNGRVVRHVHPTTPPTTSYTLPSDGSVVGERS
jgi:DNA-binding HxlR family transcriptional regulator